MKVPPRARRCLRMSVRAAMLLIAGDLEAAGSFTEPNSAAVAASQWAQYQSDAPKTILELQPFRRTETVEFAAGSDPGAATLVDLNPQINAWFLLTLRSTATGKLLSYHLENPQPRTQMLELSRDDPYGIEISVDGRALDCKLWQGGAVTPLEQAQRPGLPYAPLCGDRLFLRNEVAGSYTHLERVTNFLRDHVWGGERIVGFVRKQFYEDAFIEKADPGVGSSAGLNPNSSGGGPRAPQVTAAFTAQSVIPEHLGIDLGVGSGALVMGRWYPIRDEAGMFLSLVEPQAVGGRTLDSIEASAVDYMVALDLSRFDLGFALGTDHPRVGWSERVLPNERDSRLAGPDGIGSVAPLVVNGIVNPTLVDHVAATFAGGFKREHGAFRFGALAQRNHGTHYGFIEQGVVFSKLQPELATLFVTDDGKVQMKTWTVADAALLPHIKFARQNGVPLVEFDEKTGISSAGALVDNWGAGNWSGSDDERLRTLRAGICLQVQGETRYLVFGYFSTATPRAMARVFQAYGCRYAMHLDMNALEHTYFAVYTLKDGRIGVQHLIEGMAEVDRKGGDELAPRFLSFPDDRDFFYLTRKKGAP
jgi:hypothetical protein